MPDGPAPASPLGYRDFRLSLLASTLAFTGYGLLLPVVPLWAVHQGAGPVTAGAATGVFMASTVLTQLAVPALIRARGYRLALVWGALLLAVPAPLLIVSTEAAPILAVSFVRGAGFGLLTVCGSALIAELLPGGHVARGSGLYGLAVGLPQLLGLPAGAWLAEHWGFEPVFVVATVLPLAALVPMLLLPALPPRHAPEGGRGLRGLITATWRPWLPMLAVSTGFGAVATFAPIVVSSPASAIALFVAPGAAMLSRWVAGQVGDRMASPGRMLPGGLAVGGLGLLGFALLASNPVAAVLSAAVFGAGFGVVQNDSLVAMFARSAAGPASVAWNVAFDAGQGLGAVAVGAIVAGSSFGVAFGLLAGAALALLPVAWLARRP
ncbi:MFS transporter [Prauserella muralis]|uniref:Arabinose ABC transporter permease n=1 Tax=Prauserella muralis TaxID=588067 RepID=A0A2V4AP05_9PSEU|nr:MFS transporter [Prauserella muralis]PXY21369.1 arabinose ABC transporter permease [Prauserella muralis]TWE29663.1 putative MFS family arabinose efflux permease [Prauserella muralis]